MCRKIGKGLERFKIYTYWESPFKLTKSCTMIKIFFGGWCPELIKQRGLAADHKVRNWPCFVQKYYLCKPNIIITNGYKWYRHKEIIIAQLGLDIIPFLKCKRSQKNWRENLYDFHRDAIFIEVWFSWSILHVIKRQYSPTLLQFYVQEGNKHNRKCFQLYMEYFLLQKKRQILFLKTSVWLGT